MTRDELLDYGANRAFDREHGLTEWDAREMTRIAEIHKKRSVPGKVMAGDTVICSNPQGTKVYENGLIEMLNPYGKTGAYICVQPYIPFMGEDLTLDVSGGYFIRVPLDKLEYVGRKTRTFKEWGNCGPRARGAVEYPVEVNVFRYVSEEIY